MDCSSHKLYHVHGIDSRAFLDTYFSDKPDMVFGEDSFRFILENFHCAFNEGKIKGDHLIDISIGSLILHLYSTCGFFNQISFLKLNEKCIMELNKWLCTRTGAFCWDHTSPYIKELKGNCDLYKDKDLRLKTAIKQIVKCDIEKENLTDPVVLPQADCVTSLYLLDVTSKDENDYIKHLRKMTKFLKPGGHLILCGVLNTTYFITGHDKLDVFKYDEMFVRKLLIGEGFTIDHCNVHKRTAVSDLIDYNALMFITAHKEK
ncbi:nicotinamide N-methyltransferase-like [Mixophyes fleayi]|uniref:nicotinamide N-methyltransferase-like n=1 Tax=Mixophyes fleayi TaxID=3061075 RepID=UPI003F4DDFD8